MAARGLCDGRNCIDGADESPDAVRGSDLQPDCLGSHHRAVGEEVVGDPGEPPLDRPQHAASQRRLEFVEREAVERVHDCRHADLSRCQPADQTGSPCMCVNEIEVSGAQVRRELTNCLDVRPRIDAAARPHPLQPDNAESRLLGTIEEGSVAGSEDGVRVPLVVERQRFSKNDPARPRPEGRGHVRDAELPCRRDPPRGGQRG